MTVIRRVLSTLSSCMTRHSILWPFISPALWVRAVTTPPRFPITPSADDPRTGAPGDGRHSTIDERHHQTTTVLLLPIESASTSTDRACDEIHDDSGLV